MLQNHNRTNPTRTTSGTWLQFGFKWGNVEFHTPPRPLCWTPTAKRPRSREESGSGSKAAFALGRTASTPPRPGPLPSPVQIAAAASQQDPGPPLVFGLCLHQQWPDILSLQTAEADVGMEILLVHFTAEELSHEA